MRFEKQEDREDESFDWIRAKRLGFGVVWKLGVGFWGRDL